MNNDLRPMVILADEARKLAGEIHDNAKRWRITTFAQAGNAAAVSDMADIALEYVTSIVADLDAARKRIVELEASPPVTQTPLTVEALADAFDALWNGALSASIERQSGADTAAILATGFQAMAVNLREAHNVGLTRKD